MEAPYFIQYDIPPHTIKTSIPVSSRTMSSQLLLLVFVPVKNLKSGEGEQEGCETAQGGWLPTPWYTPWLKGKRLCVCVKRENIGLQFICTIAGGPRVSFFLCLYRLLNNQWNPYLTWTFASWWKHSLLRNNQRKQDLEGPWRLFPVLYGFLKQSKKKKTYYVTETCLS